MIKQRHRWTRIVWAAVLAVAMLLQFGCGGTTTPASSSAASPAASSSAAASSETAASSEAIPDAPAFPVAPGSVTLKYWVNPSHPDYYTTWNDLESMKVMEEKTGVHIEFIHPAAGQDAQAFNLMLASGDHPDIIQERENPLYYSGGGDFAIDNGDYLELTDLIDKYAPNYKKWITSDATIAKMTVTDSGNRWGFFHITPDVEPAWHGYVVRQDWLDELGLPLPVTLDDWHDTLVAFRDIKKAESPLLLANTGMPWQGHIMSAFDVVGDFYQENGVVKYGPIQSGFLEYLTLMNKWYAEGLVDQDFMGRTDPGYNVWPPASLQTAERAGIFHTLWGVTADAYVLDGTITDNDKFWTTAIRSPVQTEGQEIKFNLASYAVRSGTAITTACKTPEIAAMWLDYHYSEEGSDIISFGREGDTYTMVDGEPVYTQKVLDDAIMRYCRWDGPGILQYKRMWQQREANGQGQMLDAMFVWDEDKPLWNMPRITLTADEANENSNIMPDITTFVTEKVIGFIIGDVPLTEFDAFVDQIKSMNIDRAIEIQQTALDRYNARK